MTQPPILPFGQFFGNPESSLAVRGFTLTHLAPTVPEREVETHTHDEAHFVLVTAGTYLSSARGAPPVCEAPALIYNPPGTTHRDRFRSDGGRFFTISVAGAVLREVSDCVPVAGGALFLSKRLASLARRLAGETLHADGCSPLAAEALSLELLARTRQSFDREPRSSPGWLRRAGELLREERGDGLSIAGVASAVGVHPVHLTRTFRRHFRCTPGEYLRRCRLEKAAALLAGSSLPLSEIALASGFADQSHLAKSFQRAYGMTPSRYRRACSGRVCSVQDAQPD